MWKRFREFLVCPICSDTLDLLPFEEAHVDLERAHLEAAQAKGISQENLGTFVESGLLLCNSCKIKFPIWKGLPILLTYQTAVHAAFDERFRSRATSIGADYRFPDKAPVTGEEAVKASFSEEWSPYAYDGVIWELSYRDHEARLLIELGPVAAKGSLRTFLEIGCGLGLTTFHAQRNLGVDAVGVDLSTAPGKAVVQFKDNPFLHFVQASVFALPLKRQTFDVVYSRGVLHHTFSTREAFRSVAPFCRVGGTTYVWLYGPGSINASPLRWLLYGAERAVRPILSRNPSSFVADALLSPLAVAYLLFNNLRRMRNPEIQKLDFGRAIHAARDRFTPRFAHRQSVEEVSAWFRESGFDRIETVDWRDVPPADHDDFSRNTAVRGVRASAPSI